jgi:outer membrane protein TolC
MQIVKSRFIVGEASILDTLSASYDYTSAQQKLLDSKISTHRARNKLALALSLPPESLTIDDTLPTIIPDLPDPATLISLTNQYDPSLKIFEKIAEQLILNRQKISNSMLPSLSANASLSFDRSHFQALDTGDLTLKNAVIGLVFSYSLPPRKNILSKKQATIKLQDNLISRQKYNDELTVKLNELIESWDQEKQRIALTQKSKQLAQLQFLAAEKEYKQGTIERLTLLDAQNKLVENELALTRIRIEMKKLEIILDEITGTLFQRFGIKN